jgi:hypothetical protein
MALTPEQQRKKDQLKAQCKQNRINNNNQSQNQTTQESGEENTFSINSSIYEGSVSVIVYYLATWNFCKIKRFLAARLTELVIVYGLIPGIKGSIMGLINPNAALPTMAEPIQQEAFNNAKSIRILSGRVIQGTASSISNTALQLEQFERNRLEESQSLPWGNNQNLTEVDYYEVMRD